MTRPADSSPPAADTAAAPGQRLVDLEERVTWWRDRVETLLEAGGPPRDIKEARRHMEEAVDRVHAFKLARALMVVTDPERRALILATSAVADASHVAAGAHERQLQSLRAARLAEEAAEAERLRNTTDPAVAFEQLLDQLAQLPDGLRRRAAERLGATVHVATLGSPPVTAAAPELASASQVAPEPPAGAVLARAPGAAPAAAGGATAAAPTAPTAPTKRRVIGAPPERAS
jgi:hypothetical protein